MKQFRHRESDATFELNLAPMLDIIVSIVPMLLLSVVFVRIAVVETPVPQAVQKAMVEAENKNDAQIQLSVGDGYGFKIQVMHKGKTQDINIAKLNGEFDLDGLHKQIVTLKQTYPDVFKMELHPSEEVPLDKIIAVMDKVRTRTKDDPILYFTDTETGKKVETELIFPDVVFGNVAGG
jgi:biopolymer transport protein ExbD